MTRRVARVLAIALVATGLGVLGAPSPAGAIVGLPQYTNPVLGGDYPDPSVIRVGREYWATATSSGWAPIFPIFHSRDLVNWRVVGSVFRSRPRWSVGSYWAPEIARSGRRFLVYYSARRRRGQPCVAVAVAGRPEGPWSDRGPLICQRSGSIDPFPVRDERGRPHLLWKEDANSRRRPTPIWAVGLRAGGTRPAGRPRVLIQNEERWEGGVVEGPAVVRRGRFFYMFYAGNACCGGRCRYAAGVARARRLLGPWEKRATNPILAGNRRWRCPGHGTVVTDTAGRDHLLYHAYARGGSMPVGRQALLDSIVWGRDGWPTINSGQGPSARGRSPLGARERNAELGFYDEFASAPLSAAWQWPHSRVPSAEILPDAGGALVVRPAERYRRDPLGGVLARPTTLGDYVATTIVNRADMRPGTVAGLAAYGNVGNAVGMAAGIGDVVLWRRVRGRHAVVSRAPLAGSLAFIRMRVTDGRFHRFEASADGREWLVTPSLRFDGLAPWDNGVRVALTVGGADEAAGRFEWLSLARAR